MKRILYKIIYLSILDLMFTVMPSFSSSQYKEEKEEMRCQPIKTIESLDSIKDKYDLFIVDIVGVVHDGINAFPNTVKALNSLYRNPQKQIIFISNTQKLGEASKQTLIKFGIDSDVIVFTSGDAIRKDFPKKYLDKVIYHLGENLNSHLLKGLNFCITSELDKADIVLLSQYIEDYESPDQFDSILKEIVQRNIPVLCGNPDKTAPRGPNYFWYCSGTFAEKIEKWGGQVEYYGKPNVKIYEVIDDLYHPTIPREKMIMIGDTLETDIAGGKAFGISTLLTLSGNTGLDIKKSNNKVSNFLKDQLIQPTYVIEALR